MTKHQTFGISDFGVWKFLEFGAWDLEFHGVFMKEFATVLVLTLILPSQIFADEGRWKQLYDEAGQLMQDKKLTQAEKKAQESLKAAEKEFGAVHSRVGEVLYLLVAIEQKEGKTMNDPQVQDLLGRMRFIQSKVFEKKTATFPMRWSYGDAAPQWPGTNHVLLKFADFPNHHIGIYSKDLGEYLEKLGKDTVDVTFEVTYDKSLKSIPSYNQVDIGGMTHWQDSFSYGGVQGDEKPSPWDHLLEEWEKNNQTPSSNDPK